ncbi:MAG: 50S ribosomal protein L16 [Candidatus Diapherotrites archaeon]
MGLRPGKCYRRIKRAYTRFADVVPRKNYIGATPGMKTRQFNMGNPLGKYTHILDLKVEEAVQIRDNAIESVRILVTRGLTKALGKDAFFMKIRIYPYHVLRENKQAQGAHADRIQKGMSHPFGRPIGRAIQARKGLKILSVLVAEEHVEAAKKILLRANARLPCKVSVRVGTDIKSIGTLPRKVKLEEKEEKKEEEGEGKEGAEAKGEADKGKEGADAAKGKDAKAEGKGGKGEEKKGEDKGKKPEGKDTGKGKK